MNRPRTILLNSLLFLLAAGSPAVGQQAPSQAASSSKLQGLDNLADQAMKEWKVPGVALAVVQARSFMPKATAIAAHQPNAIFRAKRK